MVTCRSSLHRCCLALSGLLSCLPSLPAGAETFDGLPPPPAMGAAQQQNYMLGLSVNGRDGSDLVPVEFRDQHYLLRAEDLQKAGIPAAKSGSGLVDVSALDGVKASYDAASQRILLTVPAAWLPQQILGEPLSNIPRFAARSSVGALFNYDIYTRQSSGGGTQLSAWNELRLFGGYGQFSTNGSLQQRLSGAEGYSDNGYIRYDSWWANQNEDDVLSVRVGDLYTDALGWSNSVRLGGIQIGRDFSVRPDLITYPLPSFSGQAALPSTVDLFVNGYKASSSNVQPGPFSLTNMPFVNGAGNAVVVTTDALGRQVTTTLPFYVTGNLLKSGLSDFSFAAGALRENYGLQSFDYGPAASSGSFRYGVTDWLTLESHAEGAESLALAGSGVQVRIGSLGVVNGSMSGSRLQGEGGRQYSWGWQYTANRFNLSTQHTLRDAGYGDLGVFADRYDRDLSPQPVSDGQPVPATYFSSMSRRIGQYNASATLDRYGNLGAALIDITSGQGDRTRLLNLSWSKSLWGNSNLYLSASRDMQAGDWSGMLSLSVPFSDLLSGSISVERNQQGDTAQRFYMSRAMPTDGGFAADAAWARQGSSSGGDYRQATLRWRTQQIDTAAGYYGTQQNSTSFAQLSGSLVLMDGEVLPANQVNDAFVVVKTGYPGVKVQYENQLMGKTNRNGYLLVPRVNAYYPAKYSIDSLDLPADMAASSVEQRFPVKRQSGYLLNMAVEPLRAASVILHDAAGQPLPVGSMVSRPGMATEYVGWDGIVWMEKLSVHNPIRVDTPDGRSCSTQLQVPEGRLHSLTTYGPLKCALTPLPAPSSAGNPP